MRRRGFNSLGTGWRRETRTAEQLKALGLWK